MSTLAAAKAPTRGARISPDRPFVGVIVILIVLAVMIAAMAFSFIGLYESAAWTHNPREFWWLAPVIIDGPILVYTASYAIWRWRDFEHYAHHAMRVLIFFTGLSVTINALHVGSGWEWQWATPELYGGIAMAAVAPVGALLAAHELTRLVFMNHDPGETVEHDDEFLADYHDLKARVEDLHGKPDAEYVTAEALDTRLEQFSADLTENPPQWVTELEDLRPTPDPDIDPEPAPRPTTSLLVHHQEVPA